MPETPETPQTPAGPAIPATAATPATPPRRRRQRVARWGFAVTVTLALGLSVWSMEQVPNASWMPVLVGLVPWVVGKYLLCPLRWHALSVSGRGRGWHLRAYAEGELFGLVSPAHVGADLWRMHRLQRVGLSRGAAATEVGMDRLIGSLGLTVFVVLAGATLPPQLLVAAAVIALALVAGGLVVHRRRPQLLAERPLPSRRVLAKGVLISIGYQLSLLCLVFGAVAAMGGTVDPVALLGVFGASQVAGILPGVHGASPREGALVVGLAHLGLSWTAAVGAVALMAVLAWGPALLLGGASLAAYRLRYGRPLVAA